MYCDKDNVNTLTALLIAHGVRHAVVCPGSRNAPIVHNLDVCPEIQCYPITDERSAAFYALGLCQATEEPVVVCVTSGTALLNTLPAVAEAMYQHLPLVVVTADRPKQWIGQLTGQTMPQPGALTYFVKHTVDLPEPHNDEEHWYCNRLVNEALIAAAQPCQGPVHINVPITEPLYSFNTRELPSERMIAFNSLLAAHDGGKEAYVSANAITAVAHDLLQQLAKAERPLIVIGQMKPSDLAKGRIPALTDKHYVVWNEALSGEDGATSLEEMLAMAGGNKDFLPDFILYIGDTLVSKRAKQLLRQAKDAICWEVNADGTVHDPMMNLHGIVQARPDDVLAAITAEGPREWFDRWETLRWKAEDHRRTFVPRYSNLLAVQLLEERLSHTAEGYALHYANSTSVRLGCLYAREHVYCNRGINGIEGSLSTAAGFSLATDDPVYCVIGDLSFFYDQNALWNTNLRQNLRILLLNNSGGEIFAKFDGLRQSPARSMVMGVHATTAEGICRENDIMYCHAHNEEELYNLLGALVSPKAERPMLLEVFTNAEDDLRAYQEYFNTLL